MKKIIILFLLPIFFLCGCNYVKERKIIKIDTVPYYLYYFNNKVFAIGENRIREQSWSVIEVLNDSFIELVTLENPPQFPTLIKETLIIFGDNLKINLINRQVSDLNCPEGTPSIVLIEENALVAQFPLKIWFFQEGTTKDIAIPEDFKLININEEEMIFFDNKHTIYFTDKEFNISREMGILVDHTEKNYLLPLNPRKGFAIANQTLTNIYLYLSNQLTNININDGIKDVQSTPEGIVLIGRKLYLMDLQGKYRVIYTPASQYTYNGKSFDGETVKILMVHSILNKSLVLSITNNKIDLTYYQKRIVSLAHNKETTVFGSANEIIQIKNRNIN